MVRLSVMCSTEKTSTNLKSSLPNAFIEHLPGLNFVSVTLDRLTNFIPLCLGISRFLPCSIRDQANFLTCPNKNQTFSFSNFSVWKYLQSCLWWRALVLSFFCLLGQLTKFRIELRWRGNLGLALEARHLSLLSSHMVKSWHCCSPTLLAGLRFSK